MNRRELLTATAAVAGATLASRAAFAAPGDGIVHGGMAGRDYAPAVAAVRAYAEGFDWDATSAGQIEVFADARARFAARAAGRTT